MNNKYLKIIGARENNLKNIDVAIPKNKLIVFTGVSGSGKSSLAFNTIYTEGRRRYIESLSSYARQFLGGNEKPLVSQIEGLSPTISIDQKTTSHNPRSTVGTVTEIYDYLRLLYARIGKPYCINGHGLIKAVSIKEIIKIINQKAFNKKIMILSPLIINKKGSFLELFDSLRRNHFLRVYIDGYIHSLDEDINLKQNIKHNIDLVIDRVFYSDNEETISRVHDAIEVAYTNSDNIVKIKYLDQKDDIKTDELFSSNYACKICGFNVPELEPRLFSFNAHLGTCLKCKGLGIEWAIDLDLLMPDKNLSINEGGIKYFKNLVNTLNIEWQKFLVLINKYNIPLNIPVGTLKKDQIDIILNGSREPIDLHITAKSGKKYSSHETIEGVGKLIYRRYQETSSQRHRDYYKSYLSETICKKCKGQRLNETALSVKIGNLNIAQFCELSISDELEIILNYKLTEIEQKISNIVINELINRLNFLNEVGLRYLSLSRSATTLSGGEAQRIRLATQIGSKLSGIIYVLDEPSIGLHQKDNIRLIKTLKELRDLNNTVIVVEHDEETIRAADWIVDIGPLAGNNGGEVIAQGKLEDILKCQNSLTANYLNKIKTIPVPKKRRGGNGLVIEIKKAAEHNLQKINVKFPLNKLIVLTGVSGSGKSTLMNDVLYKVASDYLYKAKGKPAKLNKITGLDYIDKIVKISQDPIGKTPRSNPATYTSVFNDIRDLYATAQLAKERGYLKGRFSFNVKGGRCENCEGDGVIKILMQFLPTVYVTCDICMGKRYNEQTLMVKYKNKNIYDILQLTVAEALIFFDKQPKIKQKLEIISAVGIDYIKLGQPATSLSGGEAQRVKLSTHLLKKPTGKTLFLLDEPTTGLHIHDIKRLLNVLNKILDNGDSVILIEHNLDVIKTADYIIDLGPEGGQYGGKVVTTGTPEQVAKIETSYTGQFLKNVLTE